MLFTTCTRYKALLRVLKTINTSFDSVLIWQQYWVSASSKAIRSNTPSSWTRIESFREWGVTGKSTERRSYLRCTCKQSQILVTWTKGYLNNKSSTEAYFIRGTMELFLCTWGNLSFLHSNLSCYWRLTNSEYCTCDVSSTLLRTNTPKLLIKGLHKLIAYIHLAFFNICS